VHSVAMRSGWAWEAIRCGATGSSLGRDIGGRTGTVCVVGATFAPFHASNDRVIVAVPGAAASATRTGPSKFTLQHRPLISHRSLSGGAPGVADDSTTSATGLASAGTVP